MKQEDIKKGMAVIIRGKVVMEDDGCSILNVLVENEAEDSSFWVSAKDLEPAPAKPKHDLARKFRKGDRVRVVEWHGRVFGNGLDRSSFVGQEFILTKDEDFGADVSIGSNLDNCCITACCLDLIEPVENIHSERPYYVRDGEVFRSYDDKYVVSFSETILGKTTAHDMAQKLCDELSREHREKSTN